MHKKASAHFDRVSGLLRALDVTDADGGGLSLDEGTDLAVEHIMKMGAASRKVMLVGNGGSASIAGHMEMDLCNRARIRAVVFNDPPVLTALANDYGYVEAFQRLVSLWGEKGDCLIAISSSGRSENILRAVQAARDRGCSVVTFSGFSADNPLRKKGDFNFYVNSGHYGEVEAAHHALGHFLTDCVVEESGKGAG